MEPQTQLRSLYDMLRFYAPTMLAVMRDLQRAEDHIMIHGLTKPADEQMSEDEKYVIQGWTADAAKECAELPISYSLKQQFQRVAEEIGDDGLDMNISRAIAMALIGELKKNLLNELSADLFMQIPESDKRLFLEPEGWFGDAACSEFPNAIDDMRDCARCIALNQWTASVFHAMLVVEHGLRWLADRLGVPFEQKQWGVAIKHIHGAIADLEHEPRTQKRDERIEFYSELASHFFHFKGAWRNRVTHGHRRYDEYRARVVAQHVRDFMASIAQRVEP